jgi:hypothetical protein
MSNNDIDLSAAKQHIQEFIVKVLKLNHITTQDSIKTYMKNSDLNIWIAAWNAEGMKITKKDIHKLINDAKCYRELGDDVKTVRFQDRLFDGIARNDFTDIG